MSEPKPKTIKAFVLADHNDIGTGASYASGTMPDIEPGAFENYKAAGLVRLATADDAKAKPAA